MISIQSFTFNPFQENTYVLSDESRNCVIIDPGCADKEEQNTLTAYIADNGLTPVKVLNTHCHIDHILGNNFVSMNYGIPISIHKADLPVMHSLRDVAGMYGIPAVPSPDPGEFLNEGDKIKFGSSVLEILFTPGHSPGSISFVSRQQEFVIAGDVLFYDSIGRYDFPGGDEQTLLESIREKLFALGNGFTVYPGHGQPTTIGRERKHNPFLS